MKGKVRDVRDVNRRYASPAVSALAQCAPLRPLTLRRVDRCALIRTRVAFTRAFGNGER